MKNAKLQIEYIPLNKLTPYEGNARQHDEEDLQTIEASIDRYGMCDPIGIWSDKNIIVEGHGRLLALQRLGYTEAPCIRLDHLSEQERREYALAHNKTAEMSRWDFTKLEEELANLPDVDMSAFGFVVSEDVNIDDFFTEAEEKSEKEPKKIQCPHCGEWFEE